MGKLTQRNEMGIAVLKVPYELVKQAPDVRECRVKEGRKHFGNIELHHNSGRFIDTGGQQIPVRLPVKVDECLKILKREKRENPRKQIKDTREQAERVAWRILKDWVEAQMALLDIEMVRFEEIFLPYIETDNGRTIFERLEEKQFLLEG